jgi:hypothetical protein
VVSGRRQVPPHQLLDLPPAPLVSLTYALYAMYDYDYSSLTLQLLLQ